MVPMRSHATLLVWYSTEDDKMLNRKSLLIEGWEFEHCLKFLVVFLHGVGGIVEYEAKE